VNWQAVLWQEFCHVVTLKMTHNKMPRWLSEGISVHEESQANPAWGQRMNPQFRDMVLGDDLSPISQLSAAFLAPPSPVHLQFAYYEASLVVEFLVQRFGLDQLKSILRDLGEGVEINHAIEQHTISMGQLEGDFAAFARDRAQKLAPGLDFERPKLDQAVAAGAPVSETSTNAADGSIKPKSPSTPRPPRERLQGEALTAWIASHPTNYYALNERARRLLDQKQFQTAKVILEKLVELYPGETGADSGPSMLAVVHRELGETNAEWQLLLRIAQQDDEAIQAYQRLMELAAAAQNWPTVMEMARHYLAVDPLRPSPYRYVAQAGEQLGEIRAGIMAYRALLQLDPPDPAAVHFTLARLLFKAGDPEARRQVLQALEEAPRYRAALELLLTINAESPRAKADLSPASEVQR